MIAPVVAGLVLCGLALRAWRGGDPVRARWYLGLAAAVALGGGAGWLEATWRPQ